jgi:hypothetical protein
MSSPKNFAEALIKSGKGAIFSKQDIQDAYKLIPNPSNQTHLFGFSWLGKFFVDKTCVFGSKAAPEMFDSLPDTLVNIICHSEKIPKNLVCRQLDDVPIVSPKNSGLTKKFTDAYKSVCNELNIPLAPDCKNFEKAFGPSTYGTVLGINFDSTTMSWSISAEKERDLQEAIDVFLLEKTCSLKQIQKLHGKLTNISQTCKFLKGFKFNLLLLLNKFNSDSDRKIIPKQLQEDLWVWKKAIASCRSGLPLGDLFEEPPLFCMEIISDAAGAALEWHEGKSFNRTKENDRGVASLRFCNGKADKVCTLTWPNILLCGAKSRNGSFFGTKSTTLEAVGLLLPFLSYPKELANKQIVLYVDNTAVVFGWEKKYCKNDPETSVLLRALHTLEAFLCCKIFVKHRKRCSDNWSILVDNLSRKSSTCPWTEREIQSAEKYLTQGHIVKWLSNPTVDWGLPLNLLSDVKMLCK